MGQRDHYGVQQFLRDRLGKLTPGRVLQCKTADHATDEARQSAVRRGVVGAAAFVCRIEGDLAEPGPPMTIAAFGDVPPEARDQIPF